MIQHHDLAVAGPVAQRQGAMHVIGCIVAGIEQVFPESFQALAHLVELLGGLAFGLVGFGEGAR